MRPYFTQPYGVGVAEHVGHIWVILLTMSSVPSTSVVGSADRWVELVTSQCEADFSPTDSTALRVGVTSLLWILVSHYLLFMKSFHHYITFKCRVIARITLFLPLCKNTFIKYSYCHLRGPNSPMTTNCRIYSIPTLDALICWSRPTQHGTL